MDLLDQEVLPGARNYRQKHHQQVALLQSALESSSNAWMGERSERREVRVSPHIMGTFTLDKLLPPTARHFESEVALHSYKLCWGEGLFSFYFPQVLSK